MRALSRFRWFLTPTIVQALVSFAMLPLATVHLGPAEYGSFALAMALTALGITIASLGASYVLAEAFAQSDELRRKAVISGQLVASLTLGAVVAVGFAVGYAAFADEVVALRQIPPAGAYMASASMLGSIVWAIASDVATLDRRAKTYATLSILQTFLGAGVTLWTLYVTKIGGLSLFAGQLAASSVLLVGGLLLVGRYWTATGIAWIRSGGLRGSLWPTASGLLETAYTAVERNLLATFASVNQVGLYVHSQQYRSAVAAAVKAAARTLWPITLNEATSASDRFPVTRSAWAAVYVAIVIIGLMFASVGRELIGLLTHGKFTAAWPLAALGMAFLLVQNSGKPQTGYMLARGQGTSFAALHAISTSTTVALAAVLICGLGMWGAFIAVFSQQVIFRALIQWRLRGEQSVPFQDHCVVAGSLAIGALVGLNEWFALALPVRLLAFALVGAAFVIPAWRTFHAINVLRKHAA
jgi:O-antigen/teichoic acid export membrane protein